MAGPTLEELQQEWDRQHGGANGEWRVKLLVTATKSPQADIGERIDGTAVGTGMGRCAGLRRARDGDHGYAAAAVL